MLHKVKWILRHLRAARAEVLPQGKTEFESWSDEIVDLYGFPKNDSMKWTLASIILELGPTAFKRSKRYFAERLKKAIANEVASYSMYEIKEKQKAAHKAALEADVIAKASQNETKSS